MQFGEPIIAFQAIQHMLADSLTELWAARLMTYRLAENIDAGVDVKIQQDGKEFLGERAGPAANRHPA